MQVRGTYFTYLYDLLIFGVARKIPKQLDALVDHIQQPQLPDLIRRFLYDQLYPNSPISGTDMPIDECPMFQERVSVFTSAVATFFAPSDFSGMGGMHRERIRSVSMWRHGPARRDCVFIQKDDKVDGFRGLHAARFLLFFSFAFEGVTYPCALVTWFLPIGNEPCDQTGMWVVEPELDEDGERVMAVVHLDCILRGAHLIAVYGSSFLPIGFHFTDTLDAFQAYINKYADHHSHEIAF